MSLTGHVQNGVIVLEEGTTLPEGTAVRVEPVVQADTGDDWAAELLRWSGQGVNLPSDSARHHDRIPRPLTTDH
jgi:hypothetical protein